MNTRTDAPHTLGPVGDADTAKVIATVSSIPLAVDLADYDLAARAFAAEIVIDYTSLWGGEPMHTTPSWRGLVPGFDATWHQIADVEARIAGDGATATCVVDGRHYLDGNLWRPVGTYHWDLVREDGAWKVTRMVFTMTGEFGDRGLTVIAAERAKA